MKDPIADILRKLDIDMAQAVASGSAKGLGNYDEPVKQIRQQIGRELLERRRVLDEFVNDEFLHVRDIREVCQLDES